MQSIAISAPHRTLCSSGLSLLTVYTLKVAPEPHASQSGGISLAPNEEWRVQIGPSETIPSLSCNWGRIPRSWHRRVSLTYVERDPTRLHQMKSSPTRQVHLCLRHLHSKNRAADLEQLQSPEF